MTFPKKFIVEGGFRWGTQQRVLNKEGKKIGEIKRVYHLFKDKAELRNTKGKLLMTVEYRFKFFPLGSSFYDFRDKHGEMIGTVEREKWNSFLHWGTYFNIRDPDGNKIAEFKDVSL